MLRGPRSHGRAFVTSELTLAEVLTSSDRANPLPLSRRQEFLNAIVWNPTVQLMPVTRDVLFKSAELRRTTNHKLPDAIHCATAALSGCEFLISNDLKMQRLPPGITWLGVNETALDTLFGTRDV